MNVTEVTASASRKKQFGQYEPSESHVSITAELDEDDDREEVVEELQEEAARLAKEDIMQRYEAYMMKQVEGE